MKNTLLHLFKVLGKSVLFWLFYFMLLRMVFLIYYKYLIDIEMITFSEVMLTFVNAFWLDVSTACYLLIIPLFLHSVDLIRHNKLTSRIESGYTLLIIVVYSLIATGELGLFGEWRTKLSYKVMMHLSNPDEIVNSISTAQFLSLVSIWLIQSALAFYLFKKLILNRKSPDSNSIWVVFVSFFIFFAVIFTGIRGGWKAIPITTSAAYFSQHNMLNMAAVNPGYNMLLSTIGAITIKDQFLFNSMPMDEAKSIVKQLHQVEKDTTVSILQIKKPNIVVLLIESWSGDLIESLGGEAGITPNFKQLEADGLLFTNFYASANRSQQAMGSLFSGIPGLPITTITNHSEKYAALPSLTKVLKSNGYYNSFYFGGQLIYGNILSYLRYIGFDKIIEGGDLPISMPRGKLGVHDEYMFSYYATELNNNPQPFFSTLFTISSHSPYDFPMEHTILWPKLEEDFVNSAAYTDRSLGEFFALAKQQEWYNNTLFVVMADHSHSTYRNHPIQTYDYHKIPLLLCGPALADSLRGKQTDLLSGNTDVTATLLSQLGLNTEQFHWSKNLFNPTLKPFAYFELNEGFGWKRPEGEYVWNQLTQTPFVDNLSGENRESIIREGKAYLQVWYNEFLGY